MLLISAITLISALDEDTVLKRAEKLASFLEDIALNNVDVDHFDHSITPGLWWLQKRLMNVIDNLKET